MFFTKALTLYEQNVIWRNSSKNKGWNESRLNTTRIYDENLHLSNLSWRGGGGGGGGEAYNECSLWWLRTKIGRWPENVMSCTILTSTPTTLLLWRGGSIKKPKKLMMSGNFLHREDAPMLSFPLHIRYILLLLTKTNQPHYVCVLYREWIKGRKHAHNMWWCCRERLQSKSRCCHNTSL